MRKNYSLMALALLAAAAATALLLKAQDLKPRSSDSSHFLLAQGEYTVIGSPDRKRNMNVFKIDTQTGETWIYIAIYDTDGHYREGWARTGALNGPIAH